MTVISRDFGEIFVEDEMIINFPNGVFAFEDVHRFVLLSPLGDNVYPMWLQCIDNPDLCFIVFDPTAFYEGYSVNLEQDDIDSIKLNSEDDIHYLTIAVVPQDFHEATVNLKSPIVINFTENKAVQVIAHENYPLKHPVFLKEESNHVGSN